MDARERRKILERLRQDAQRIAERFDLKYRAIDAEDPRVKRRYGSCYQDGRIRVRLMHARTGEPLKYSSLIDTLCHELAHLRYFHHGPAFRAFFLYLLDWAREQGIYQPRARQTPAAPAMIASHESAAPPPRRRRRAKSAAPELEQLTLF